ncbi:MAG TPA: DUF99 family protein [Nitrososphaeria archaeon]|nr:DUF99 family protein [Nitrososphaeria archaeon]
MSYHSSMLQKKGVRVLGVAESFRKPVGEKAVLAGVVMRGDFVVDGVVFGECLVGGLDATDGIIEMYRSLRREDVMALMLNGCIISWFNVIDLHRLHSETRLPVISVTYEPSAGIREYFIKYFPEDWEQRVEIYERNGPRVEITNKNNLKLYVRAVGIGLDEAAKLLNRFTLFGRIPEPLRVAKLIARSLLTYRAKRRLLGS